MERQIGLLLIVVEFDTFCSTYRRPATHDSNFLERAPVHVRLCQACAATIVVSPPLHPRNKHAATHEYATIYLALVTDQIWTTQLIVLAGTGVVPQLPEAVPTLSKQASAHLGISKQQRCQWRRSTDTRSTRPLGVKEAHTSFMRLRRDIRQPGALKHPSIQDHC